MTGEPLPEIDPQLVRLVRGWCHRQRRVPLARSGEPAGTPGAATLGVDGSASTPVPEGQPPPLHTEWRDKMPFHGGRRRALSP